MTEVATSHGTAVLGISVPLFNEEAVLQGVVERLLGALRPMGEAFRIALVDNGSTDRTPELVDQLALEHPELIAVHLRENQGYGGGILAGLDVLEAVEDPEVLGWTWGDGQVDPSVIPSLFAACRAGSPLAKARRTERRDGRRRKLVSQTYHTLLHSLGIHTPDVNGCPKLLRKDAWQAISPTSEDWFLDCEVVIGVEKRGWSIHDEPVIMEPRAGGESKVDLHTCLEFAENLARFGLGERGR